jgi:tRNA pseudouridine65 synthase
MNTTVNFDILYEDEHYIAINKPIGILVHRTRLSEDTEFVLQLLRDQINQHVYPLHRLDRATSGVLMFGKNQEMASRLGLRFQDKQVDKRYRAIVRGWVPEQGTIDYPLADAEVGQTSQPAITHYWCLGKSEIPEAIGSKYPTARFSLIEVEPETGRRQQIRKHFAHVFHPIIGDKRHGDCKHNTYFRDLLQVDRLLFHAHTLGFQHPEDERRIELRAPIDEEFMRALELTQLMGYWEVAVQKLKL